MSSAATASPRSGARPGTLPLLFLGLLAALQGADPNINSSALLTASEALDMGSLSALAASISTLFVAATVITTGMLADRLGRRKVLSSALILGAAGDVIVAIAPTSSVYLLGRSLTGIAMGAVYGAAFAYVKHFASGKAGLAGALGIFGAGTGIFAVLLTFAGSSLVGVDWRVAFLLIPAMSLVSLVIGLRVLPKDGPKESTDRPWDIPGQIVLGLGIIGFLYGISYLGKGLLHPLCIGPLGVGIVLLIIFFVVEHKKGEKGFFPVRLFAQPLFIAALFAGLIYNMANGAMLLSFSTLFQYQLNFAGMSLSVAQLPFLLAIVAGALFAGRLQGSGKLGNAGVINLGSLILVIGVIWFGITAMSHPTTIWPYLPPLVLAGFGLIMPSIPYGGLILREADPANYGVVSSSRTTIGQFFYSLGLSVSTVIIDGVTRATTQAKLGGDAGQQVREYGITGHRPTNPRVLPTAIDALGGAFAVMCFVLAAVVVVAAIVATILIKRATPKQNPDVKERHGVAVVIQKLEVVEQAARHDLSKTYGEIEAELQGHKRS